VLDPTRGPEDLDQSLVDRGFAAPQTADLTAPDGSTLRRLSSVDEGFELLAQTEALRAWGRDAGWSGLWWTRGREGGDPLMLTCAALPTAEEFGWLLQSRLSPAERDDTNPSAYT
jgi:hypothetical protein